jgi:hypothetical protein
MRCTFELTSDTTAKPVVLAGATLEIGSGNVFSGTVGTGIKAGSSAMPAPTSHSLS